MNGGDPAGACDALVGQWLLTRGADRCLADRRGAVGAFRSVGRGDASRTGYLKYYGSGNPPGTLTFGDVGFRGEIIEGRAYV